jgi:hypothetical protein
LIAVIATMLGGMSGVFTMFLLAFVRSGKEEKRFYLKADLAVAISGTHR